MGLLLVISLSDLPEKKKKAFAGDILHIAILSSPLRRHFGGDMVF